MNFENIIFKGNSSRLSDFKTYDKNAYESKKAATKDLKGKVKLLSELQEVLYAYKKHSVLIVLQGIDASGKDSLIKHVFSGVNPQGVDVHRFKAPSAEELAHDYLWRVASKLPKCGHISIFNRSHYEEVLVTRVHPEYLAKQHLTDLPKSEKEFEQFWKTRFEDINNFERFLTNNGIVVLKFFLNLSKDEQKNRFLRRIDRLDKNWKFSADDLDERDCWNLYQNAYEEMLKHTSTDFAPWYVIPADEKKYARPLVCDIITQKIQTLGVHFPKVGDEEKQEIIASQERLMNEK